MTKKYYDFIAFIYDFIIIEIFKILVTELSQDTKK
jgi:hypothetical protein